MRSALWAASLVGLAAVAAEAQTAAPRDAQLDSQSLRDSLAAARERHDLWMFCVQARMRDCEPPPSALDRLLIDDTLRQGDIVATPGGLKTFVGKPETPHVWADFR